MKSSMRWSCSSWSATICVLKVGRAIVSPRCKLQCHISGASFAENFYGLKRRRRPIFETERTRAAVGGVPAEEKLRSREIWGSLLFLVRNLLKSTCCYNNIDICRSGFRTCERKHKTTLRSWVGDLTQNWQRRVIDTLEY